MKNQLRFLVVPLLAALTFAACDDDDDKSNAGVGVSAAGQSCARTADCVAGLICVNNICSESGVVPGTDGGVIISQVLGNEGESCTRRADCRSGLACIEQRCTTNPAMPEVDGGVPPSLQPRLGRRGESCAAVRDCGLGLTCVPTSDGNGVCDLDMYGLEPTGKVCGAECREAVDCCQLPPNVTIGTDAVRSCEDILSLLGGNPATACASPGPGTPLGSACFYYSTYCTCVGTPWACTANKCVYTAKCERDGDLFKGCPTRTRSGAATVTATCDAGTSTCKVAAVTGCASAAECLNKPVSDDATDTCTTDECTCLSSSCYRKCDEPQDCPYRFTCDDAMHVCVPGAQCTGNAQCAVALRDVKAVCKAGACVLPCESDHDCSGSGLAGENENLGAFRGLVCSSAKICERVGCSTDEECLVGSGNEEQRTLRLYCTAPAPAPAGVTLRSAISD